MKCCWIRRILIGVPVVMLLAIYTLFCCEFVSVGFKSVSKLLVKPSPMAQRGFYPAEKSLNVAHFVSYSVAASLLVASTGFACKCCSNSGGCKVTPPPVE